MSRRSCTFRQRDVEAALRAARAAGLEVSGYIIAKDGTIHVQIGKAAELSVCGKGEWDDVLNG